MGALAELVEPTEGGVRIPLHIQPRASKSRVVGVHGDSVKLQISSPPVDGAANDEVVRMLAKLLGVPKGSVCIVQGQRSRRKVVVVEGVDAASAGARLEGAAQ